jgi:hypothetical protein
MTALDLYFEGQCWPRSSSRLLPETPQDVRTAIPRALATLHYPSRVLATFTGSLKALFRFAALTFTCIM